MKISLFKVYYFLTLILAMSAIYCFGQTPESTQTDAPFLETRSCKNGTNKAFFEITSLGDIQIRPCAGRSIFLNGALFSASGLPSQTGHNGKFLTTNGTAASWATLPAFGDITGAATTTTAYGSPVWKDEAGGILFFRELQGTNGIATTWNEDSIFISGASLAPLASPALTGNPTAPTPATSDFDTSIATTAFVQANLSSYAPITNPAFAGTNILASTPPEGDDTNRIATTAWVNTAIANAAGGGAVGAAGGDLTGTFPNPTIAKLQGRNLVIAAQTDPFGDEFTGAFDETKWTRNTAGYTPDNNGGFFFHTSTGGAEYANLLSNFTFDFNNQYAIWEYDYTGTTAGNDSVRILLTPDYETDPFQFPALEIGFWYSPVSAPTSIILRFVSNDDNFVSSETLTGQANKFRLTDNNGVMEYYVMYVGESDWTLIDTFDYTGDQLFSNQLFVYSGAQSSENGINTVRLDRIETSVYSSYLADKSLIWWNEGAGQFNDVTLNTFSDALFERTITPPGTTGNVTINTRTGTVNFAPATSNITVSNTLVTTDSIITAVKRDTDPDPTCRVDAVVPSNGSFSILLEGGCTDETSFGFVVH